MAFTDDFDEGTIIRGGGGVGGGAVASTARINTNDEASMAWDYFPDEDVGEREDKSPAAARSSSSSLDNQSSEFPEEYVRESDAGSCEMVL